MATATRPTKTRPFVPATTPAGGTVLPKVQIVTDKGVVSEFGLFFPTPHPEVARAAVRMVKDDGEMYDISLGVDGVARCDCADGTFHPERPGGCKHLRALRALIRKFAGLTALADAVTPAGPPPAE